MSMTAPKFSGAIPGKHLGRRPPTDAQRKKCIPLAPFIDLKRFTPPATFGYFSKASFALRMMLGNDSQGDCEAVTIVKSLAVAAAERPGGTSLSPTAAETLAFYHAQSGPADNGMVMVEAMDWARDKGVRIGSALHYIDGYALVDNTNPALVNACAFLFGGLHVGIELPNAWYQHADDTDVWDMTSTRVVGGHAVPATGFDASQIRLATWGKEPHITRAAFHSQRYVDECYAVLNKDWWTADGLDTNGVNVSALRAALEAIRNGGTPDIPPDPNPPTPPAPPTPPIPAGGTWTGSGNLEIWGHQFPLTLAGIVSGSQAATGANLWTILADLAAVAVAFRARDWVAVAAAVQQLLADLGMTMTDQEFSDLMRALQVERATRVLVDSRK